MKNTFLFLCLLLASQGFSQSYSFEKTSKRSDSDLSSSSIKDVDNKIYTIDTKSMFEYLTANNGGKINLSIENESYDLVFEPIDILHEDFKISLFGEKESTKGIHGISTYIVYPKDQPENLSRFTLTKNGIYGKIKTKNDFISIMSLKENHGDNHILVYYEKDVIENDHSNHSCGILDSKVTKFESVQTRSIPTSSDCREIGYTVSTDYEFYSLFLNTEETVEFIMAVVNEMDGVYNNGQLDINIYFKIIGICITTEEGFEPWGNSDNFIDGLRIDFQNWADGFSGFENSILNSMITGIGSYCCEGGVGGAATGVGDLNNPTKKAANVNKSVAANFNQLVKLITHECGHNFGGSHSPNGGPPPGHVMNASGTNTGLIWHDMDPHDNVSSIRNLLLNPANENLVCGSGENYIYVNDDATGANDGSSWEDAFTDLQDAIVLDADCNSPTKILVAEGTYHPSTTSSSAVYNLKDCIEIYGGFPEPTNIAPWWNDRDPELYPTLISGEIGDPNSTSDNSKHLFRAEYLVDVSIVIDGFQMKGSTKNSIITLSQTSYNLNLSIRNCTFEDLVSSANGSAIYASYTSGVVGVLNIENCTFLNNSSLNYGGAVYLKGVSGTTLLDVNITKSIFQNNFTTTSGGAIYALATNGATFDLDIEDCEFDSNGELNGSVTTSGGAIYTHSLSNSQHTLNMRRTILKNNTATFGGAIRSRCSTSFYGNIYNSIFSENIATSKGSDLYHNPYYVNSVGIYNLYNVTSYNSSSAHSFYTEDANRVGDKQLNFYNSIVSGGTIRIDDKSTAIIENTFITEETCPNNSTCTNIIYNQDPLFKQLPDPSNNLEGDFNLQPGSPALDKSFEGLDTDFNNELRPAGGAFDWGAIETQETPFVVYVNDDVSSTIMDGKSWETAFPTLNEALSFSIKHHEGRKEIRMAEGIYYPGTSPSNFFDINEDVTILGGFPDPNNNNPSLIHRNPDLYSTVLSGEIGDPNSTTDNSANLIRYDYVINKSVVLDGLQFRSSTQRSVLILSQTVYDMDITIRNCSFEDLASSNSGAAIFASYTSGVQGKVIIENCRFLNNSAATHGGAIYLKSAGASGILDVDIKNCTFQNNYAFTNGGAIYTTASLGTSFDLNIEDSDFDSNGELNGVVTASGGAIYTYSVSNSIHTLNIERTILKNNKAKNGGAIRSRSTTSIYGNIYNSIFSENTATVNGNDLYLNPYNLNAIGIFNLYNVTSYNSNSGHAFYVLDGNKDGDKQLNFYNSIIWGGTILIDGKTTSIIDNSIITESTCPDFSTCTSVIYNQDPLFTQAPDVANAVEGDFTLQAASPALDATSSGESIDFFGTSRAQFSNFDIGAVENRDLASDPIADTDGDGIPDEDDNCPNIAGIDSFDGCLDTDGDGIADPYDCAPNDPLAFALDNCNECGGNNIACSDADLDGYTFDVDPDDNDPCVPDTTHHYCVDLDNDGITGSNDPDDLDPCTPDDTNGYCVDADGDGIVAANDPDDNDPCNPDPYAVPEGDCDGDGYTNGEEENSGTDPMDPTDTPDICQGFPLSFEDFEAYPYDWYAEEIIDSDLLGNKAAYINALESPSPYLQSTIYNLTESESVHVTFKVYLENYVTDWETAFDLEITHDFGVTWHNVGTMYYEPTIYDNGIVYNVSFSYPENNQTANFTITDYFRFNALNSSSGSFSVIDDITITMTCLPENITDNPEESEMRSSSNETTSVSELELAPNPAVNEIRLTGAKDIAKVQVIDLTGSQIMNTEYEDQDNARTIDVQSYKSGTYFVRVQYADASMDVARFIVIK